MVYLRIFLDSFSADGSTVYTAYRLAAVASRAGLHHHVRFILGAKPERRCEGVNGLTIIHSTSWGSWVAPGSWTKPTVVFLSVLSSTDVTVMVGSLQSAVFIPYPAE